MPRPILSTTGRRQRPIDTSAGRFSSNAIVFAVCAPRDWDENGLEKSPLAGCYDAWHLVYGRTNQPGQSNKHNYLSQSVGYGNSRRTAYCCLYIDCRVFFFFLLSNCQTIFLRPIMPDKTRDTCYARPTPHHTSICPLRSWCPAIKLLLLYGTLSCPNERTITTSRQP